MSVYASFDESPGDLLCSNRGWGDLARWTRTLPARPFLGVVQLCDRGYATNPATLADQLEAAVKHAPPEAEGVTATVAVLVLLLRANAGAEAVFITDGMGK